MHLQSVKNINTWLEKQISSPSDTSEIITSKKGFVLFLAPGIPLLIIIGLILWWFGVKKVASAMWIFALFELIIMVSFIFIHRRTNLFALINQYFHVVFSFAGVLYFGGILNSAGLVFVGLAGALQSLSFLRPAQIRHIFTVYIFTIILEAILQPYLTPVPEITPTINLILFVLHLFVIANALYDRLNYYIRESIQAKKQEAEHLKELDTIKTNFYTNITHEFRTPLTVILGLTNPGTQMSDTQLRKGIPMIRRNGIRLLQLVNQMLDLCKLEAGVMKLNLIQADIISYFNMIIEPFQYLANEKNINFHFQTQLKELKMDFDAETMDSLTGNLLTNAIKYSSEKSTILFTVSEQAENYKQDEFAYSVLPKKRFNTNQLLKLVLKDTGIGIEPKELPLIFNRFYQATNNTIQHKEGVGIGLLLVKELVNLLDGSLYISSTPDEGTEITILLPINNRAKEYDLNELSPTLISDDEPNYNTENVQNETTKELPHLLLIEDNDDVVNYLHFVAGKRYQIERAKDGNQGVEMALNTIPDIIICDILMPLKNGYEVCDELKKDFRTSHIPIVLLTAKIDKESQISGFERGADAYITKPFNPRELLIRLQKLIEIRNNLRAKYKTLAIVSESHPKKLLNPDEQFLIKTKEILECRFSDDSFDTSALANQLGMSRSQLFRKLKALTGLSASHFLRFYRLSVAKVQIEKTKLPISEIAYEVGFKDPAYFSRMFAQEFGNSPKASRQQFQNE